MLLEGHHQFSARRQIGIQALGPLHGVRPAHALLGFSGKQDRVRHIACSVDDAAEVDLAFCKRRNLDLLHAFSC